jgi:hypothetical protein
MLVDYRANLGIFRKKRGKNVYKCIIIANNAIFGNFFEIRLDNVNLPIF